MLTKEECSGSIGKRSDEGPQPRPVSTNEFEKARKKCLTNGIECGILIESLARATARYSKVSAEKTSKSFEKLEKSS